MKSKGKTMRRFHQYWLTGSVIGIAFACSGDPEVSKDNDLKGSDGGTSGEGQGGSKNGSGGAVSVSGGSSNNNGGENSDPNGDAGSEGNPIEDAGLPDVTFDYDPEGTGDEDACAVVEGEATLVKKPIDIIISIDNSSSMSGEIAAVQERINEDFAQILEDSDIDYRVIMVSRYGNINFTLGDTNFSVCIGPPLGNASCPNNPAPTLVNTERFFHHSTDIGSNNMWCRLLAAYNTADEIPQSRSGWQKVANCVGDSDPNCVPGWQWWLRPDAFKVFVGITDDDPETNDSGTSQKCTTASGFTNNQAGAQNFDEALRTLAPSHFGAYDESNPDANRNYAWYSIVGMAPKAAPDQTVPYQPADGVVTTHCSTGGGADGAGEGYQYLSKMTGGLRYSNCLNDDFDAIFNAIAEGVIEGSKTSCEYDVPVPEGGIVDLDETKVTYIPGDGGADVKLTRAADEEACSGGAGFYFNEALDKLFLCPSSCTTVQDDDDAKLNIDFGCLGS